MKVQRVVANITAPEPGLADKFYGQVLGMDILMDMNWIRTYGSNAKMTVQVSFMSEGGSGTPVPELSIEVDDVDGAFHAFEKAGFRIEYGPANEPWGVRRFFVRDPFGRLVNILSHITAPGPSNVPPDPSSGGHATQFGKRMALNELETARARKILDEYMERHRPPAHVRHELDLAYRITGQSVELLEVRPAWDRPNEKMERPVAKATFVRRQNLWRIYWRRANLKWHLYEKAPEVSRLQEFLSEVEADPYGCFWG